MNNLVWKYVKRRSSLEEIRKVEQELGVGFPTDYVECVLVNDGGRPRPNEVQLPSGHEVVFGVLLSFAEDDSNSLIESYRILEERLPTGVVPFADDPSGNCFCFDFSQDKDNPSIVFWYHEYALAREDYEYEGLGDSGKSYEEVLREEAIRPVCGSFTELLSMLKEL
ncbi:SMI1/KNR4 family protein [Tumebacillus sp. DT12]|uniref:SMI1/KNR4 family protein n=1 Tax=Tumebacillus lacus TaxID=2995335 RepID=A0ABT3WYV9_9BACL|nr:SMI1/KNR4 family protein [Tumebacillus lacus]MCX7568687.1 SMI1/KNR4 family protein [Tumebacillus lacus]